MSELILLLHHTPILKTLIIRYLYNYDFSTLDDTNLIIKSLNIFLYYVPFNNIKFLLKHMRKLKNITIKGHFDDYNYRSSKQWQTILTSSLPLLKVLSVNIDFRGEHRYCYSNIKH
ncbi:unnamed protein product, partial [Didymodactylos carnosus]